MTNANGAVQIETRVKHEFSISFQLVAGEQSINVGTLLARSKAQVRTVIQRVSEASVTVDGQTVGHVGAGLCIFLGVGKDDNSEKAAGLADKVKNLRIFEDELGKLNRSVLD